MAAIEFSLENCQKTRECEVLLLFWGVHEKCVEQQRGVGKCFFEDEVVD